MLEFCKVKDLYKQHLIEQCSASTIRSYLKSWRLFEEFYKKNYNKVFHLEEVTVEQLNRFFDECLYIRGNQPSTVQNIYYGLSSLFSFAHKKGFIDYNCIPEVKRIHVEKQEASYITEKSMEQLTNAITHPVVKVIVPFLFYTGLRISEALQLELEDVNLTQKNIFVRHGKGGKTRNVPILPQVEPIIRSYLAHVRPNVHTANFFVTKKTGKVSDVYVNRLIQKGVKELGWEQKITCHVLRHSFTSYMLQKYKGMHLVHLKELLGHESLASTGIYSHFQEGEIQELIIN